MITFQRMKSIPFKTVIRGFLVHSETLQFTCLISVLEQGTKPQIALDAALLMHEGA